MEQHITSEEWEKEFDKEFTREGSYPNSNTMRPFKAEPIKSFIRSLLQAQQQKFRETLEQIELPTLTHQNWCDSREGIDRCNCNQADAFDLIKDIKRLLSQLPQS